ncbi:hypothetical protein MRX96_001981 [Rhipicephalus microplus]
MCAGLPTSTSSLQEPQKPQGAGGSSSSEPLPPLAFRSVNMSALSDVASAERSVVDETGFNNARTKLFQGARDGINPTGPQLLRQISRLLQNWDPLL